MQEKKEPRFRVALPGISRVGISNHAHIRFLYPHAAGTGTVAQW